MPGFSFANPGCNACGCGHSLPPCPCNPVPDTVNVVVQDQPTNGTNSIVFSHTLVYGPKPADLGAYRADDPGWYSSSAYFSINGWYKVRYHFSCQQGLYDIRATTTLDSPLPMPEWSIASWIGNFFGNTCSPFHVAKYTWHFPEGQSDQHLSIDGA